MSGLGPFSYFDGSHCLVTKTPAALCSPLLSALRLVYKCFSVKWLKKTEHLTSTFLTIDSGIHHQLKLINHVTYLTCSKFHDGPGVCVCVWGRERERVSEGEREEQTKKKDRLNFQNMCWQALTALAVIPYASWSNDLVKSHTVKHCWSSRHNESHAPGVC